jgi:hypothetical protein
LPHLVKWEGSARPGRHPALDSAQSPKTDQKEETAVMQTQGRIGFDLVSRIGFLAQASEIVLTHQERFDGAGYPQGLRGNKSRWGQNLCRGRHSGRHNLVPAVPSRAASFCCTRRNHARIRASVRSGGRQGIPRRCRGGLGGRASASRQQRQSNRSRTGSSP